MKHLAILSIVTLLGLSGCCCKRTQKHVTETSMHREMTPSGKSSRSQYMGCKKHKDMKKKNCNDCQSQEHTCAADKKSQKNCKACKSDKNAKHTFLELAPADELLL